MNRQDRQVLVEIKRFPWTLCAWSWNQVAGSYAFIRDLSGRVKGRFQLTADELRTYVLAVEEYFGADVDYGQMVRHYRGAQGESPDWFGAF